MKVLQWQLAFDVRYLLCFANVAATILMIAMVAAASADIEIDSKEVGAS
jgi:hypothetical protein